VRILDSLGALMEADELTKRAIGLIAGANRILNEKPVRSDRLSLGVSVNGVDV
jgi:hypothetical protein